jgi:YcaO-like protein with predicted kinase domain
MCSGLINHYLSQIKLSQIWGKKAEKNDLFQQVFPFNDIGTLKLVENAKENQYHTLAKSICYSLTNKKLYTFPEEFIVRLSGSHGLASGNTKEEAIIHGISECIERLSALYLLDSLPECNKISIDSLTHPTLKRLIKLTLENDVEFEILDLTFLFNIPTFIVIFNTKKWELPNFINLIDKQFPLVKIGIDTEPQDALMRCFTEFYQGLLPLYEATASEHRRRNQLHISQLEPSDLINDISKSLTVTVTNSNQPLSVDLRKYLSRERKEIPISEIHSLYDINNKVEIERVVSILKNQNIEVFVKDITNPSVPFPVVSIMFSGGANYFSKIPLIGYFNIILGAKNEADKFSLLEKKVNRIFSPSIILEILKNQRWCVDTEQQELIQQVINTLYTDGIDAPLWGVPINKLYFLSLLYLRMNQFEKAMNCIDAALYDNLHFLPAIITKTYIYSKLNDTENFNDLQIYANILKNENIDFQSIFKRYENHIIDPNPFPICDQNCNSNSNSDLCKNCFFHYVKEDVFLRTILDKSDEEFHLQN